MYLWTYNELFDALTEHKTLRIYITWEKLESPIEYYLVKNKRTQVFLSKTLIISAFIRMESNYYVPDSTPSLFHNLEFFSEPRMNQKYFLDNYNT